MSTPPPIHHELSPDQLRREVADLLGVPAGQLAADVSLPDQGLDSVRLMTLVENWRARGAELTFADLAERPTLKEWSELLAIRAGHHG
ncbi:phosphopantetheine-binding protein [Streptomyces sp. NPDC002659]|uniref:phosphopantetheine-binding protein n=1 Tax=Streptomyces sp. NPDC002659 TaxID=3364656 RepID=UPI0036B74549